MASIVRRRQRHAAIVKTPFVNGLHSTRFAFRSLTGMWFSEGIGQLPSLVRASGRPIAFDSSGQRLVFEEGPGPELRTIRLDGSDERSLEAAISPPARLFSYSLVIR